jgi:hypothetical protein
MRHKVLGRDIEPSLSTVSSWSTSPRAGMTALWHSASNCSLRSWRVTRSVIMQPVVKVGRSYGLAAHAASASDETDDAS